MIRYALAGPGDDAALARLQATPTLPSWVELSLERAPSSFAGGAVAAAEYTVLAYADGETQPIGMYTCAPHRVYVNGEATSVGYLGGLRVVPAWRHRLRPLRGGYASIARVVPGQARAPFWYTSVAADNRPARRLLERGLPALPGYRLAGTLVTLAVAAARAHAQPALRRARAEDREELLAFHRAQAQRCNFAPVLDAALLEQVGIDNFLLLGAAGGLRGCVAVWDRQRSRRIVVRAYRSPLGSLRPVYNAWARLLRRVHLPAPGTRLDHSFLAFVSSTEDAAATARMLRAALAFSRAPTALIGVPADGSLHRALAGLASFAYRTCIYTVSFGAPPALDGRTVAPDAALL